MKPQIRSHSEASFRHWADGISRLADETGAFVQVLGAGDRGRPRLDRRRPAALCRTRLPRLRGGAGDVGLRLARRAPAGCEYEHVARGGGAAHRRPHRTRTGWDLRRNRLRFYSPEPIGRTGRPSPYRPSAPRASSTGSRHRAARRPPARTAAPRAGPRPARVRAASAPSERIPRAVGRDDLHPVARPSACSPPSDAATSPSPPSVTITRLGPRARKATAAASGSAGPRAPPPRPG